MTRTKKSRKNQTNLEIEIPPMGPHCNMDQFLDTPYGVRQRGRKIGSYRLPDLVRKFG